MPATTIAVIAASTAAGAAAEAEHAQRVACQGMIQTFDAHEATVEAARMYAKCVQAVYGSGDPLSSTTLMGLKIAVGLAALGAIIGWRHDSGFGSDYTDKFMLALAGAMLLPATVALITVAVGVFFL